MYFLQHDHTVVGLLNALGVYDRKAPSYAATIFVELLSDLSIPKYVRVIVILIFKTVHVCMYVVQNM